MTIVLATDEKFVQHCSVTIASVLKHNVDVCFYIMTEGLTDESVSILQTLAEKYGGKLNVCKVDSSIVNKFPMPANAGDHISVATYYRLLTEYILPSDVDKYIYMDCDMVVRESLIDLWNQDISDYAIGAVFQACTDAQDRDKERLGIQEKFGYFNAGLLLVNLKYWRENNVTKRLLAFIENHYASIKQHDQDVLNAILYKEVKPISYTWNFLPQFLNDTNLSFKGYVDYSQHIANPIVIHYVSAPKPWDFGCKHPYKSEYYKYLGMTSFSGFRPKFIWKKYYRDVLKHKIIKWLIRLDFFNLRSFLIKK